MENVAGRGPGARLIVVIPAAAVLVLGLDAGLLLLGLPMPVIAPRLADLHAPLLVFGFVGTLVSLERAVALRSSAAYAAPALLVAGVALCLSPAPEAAGRVLVTAGLAAHALQYAAIWRRQPMTATAVQACGAVCALVAGIAWTGGVGSPVGWLVRFDIARAAVKTSALPRYVAACLLTGYGWLTVAGVGWLLGGARIEGRVYDATTHAIFLGFVITVIMAHAPLILPAVLRVRIPYSPALFVPVALLQAALLARVVGGDAWGSPALLRAGGIGAAVAIALFALTAATLSVRSRPTTKGRADRVAA